eukprot:CAMPEP_0185030632 /NCGR_PEP_ID=MMETSP1103-20130426/17609_1 /TAXON_ID=36769 /ORGANISM="Paraphysomonas bandaiensis, Strain Caron Lab Isolate" /LENGTH=802 /DNA_ID=CAMNT_0027565833 /DNA_START=132 /DNA_END=2540 /DNA_ORIENTATION=+
MNIINDPVFPKFIEYIADKARVKTSIAQRAIELLHDGATVPFIVRYRQQQIGGINSDAAYLLDRELGSFRAVVKTRNTRLDKLKKDGKCSEDVTRLFMSCFTMDELDEAYSVYKESTSTKVQRAKEIPGLEDIACGVVANTVSKVAPHQSDEYYECLGWLVADQVAHSEETVRLMRQPWITQSVQITCTEKKATGDKKGTDVGDTSNERMKYRDYFSFSKSVKYLSAHQVLAIRRGKDSAGALTVRFSIPDRDVQRFETSLRHAFGVPPSLAVSSEKHPLRRHHIVAACIADAVKRIISPMITRAAWREAIQRAEENAVQLFSSNLKSLLLTPPLRSVLTPPPSPLVVCGVDPGLKQGHKLVILDCSAEPRVLHREKFICFDSKQVELVADKLRTLCSKFSVSVLAVGNGVGRREAQLVCDAAVQDLPGVRSALVSEAGASVYSVSSLAQEEYPEEEVTYRGAISIALRLVDPLCEMVKVPPASLGIGMYQHDIKEKVLEKRLGAVLEEVVSEVGADVNTASEHILSYASGIGRAQAKAIVQHRVANGPFSSLEDLKSVRGIGKIAFQNSAGFLRILGGSEPLDGTIVHPEMYDCARSLLRAVCNNSNANVRSLLFSESLRRALESCNWSLLASSLREDVDQLRTIGRWLSDPIYSSTAHSDVRGIRGVPPQLLRRSIPPPGNFAVGDEVVGTVRNITSFGTFVDIGAEDDALLHKSKYGARAITGFVIGESVNVKILSIERAGKGQKIALTNADTTAVGSARNIDSSVSDGAASTGNKRDLQPVPADYKNSKRKRLKYSGT